ncbi:MAG: iron ABC transporter substrate-binding protein [Thermoproteota archaeon]|nr:MAG: iron ABC transporter substrate-binding protein [Candidatus Korarchaeota archaeon]
MRRILLLIFLVGVISVIFAGYVSKQVSEKPEVKGATIKIIDAVGREVEVPKNVERILALSCALREVVHLLQGDVVSKVVGVESVESRMEREVGKFPKCMDLPYIAAYPKLQSKPCIRSGRTLNYEKIIELKPDVIFVGPWSADEADKIQEKTGVPVVVVYVSSIGTDKQLQRYYESLRLMGKILGREQRAEELIEIINSYLEDLRSRTKGIPNEQKPKVYIAGRAYYGAHGILATDPHWPPFEWIYANNVASGISNESTGLSVDKEALIKWNPDHIFISEASLHLVLNDIKSDPAYQSINAIKKGRVYGVLPYCWYAYNKELGIIDAYYIGKIIYPDRFKDVDINKKAEEVFEKFLGNRSAYYTIVEQFGGFKKIEEVLV